MPVKHQQSISYVRRVGLRPVHKAISLHAIMAAYVCKGTWSREGLKWLKGQARDLAAISDAGELWRGQLHVELGLLEAVTKSLKAVESKLDKMGASDERINRLQTINGVGPRLAETVVAFLDDPKRFKSAKEVGSYAGLVPRQYQSGRMERQGRTGGRGNRMLRNLLVEVCWTSLGSNPWARDTYNRLLRGSSLRKKMAITALARRLVVRCWTMLRDEQDWKDNIQKRIA